MVAGLEFCEFVEDGVGRLGGVFADPGVDCPFGEAQQGSEFGVGNFVVGDFFIDGSLGDIEVCGQFFDGHDFGGHGRVSSLVMVSEQE